LRKDQFGAAQGEKETEELEKPEDKFSGVVGLEEFKLSVECEKDKNYDESEMYLKETLKILKQADQHKTLGYLFILKRLAYVSFKNNKFTESEKYFSIVTSVMPSISENPMNIF
jgi:hypothetical protein